MSFLENISNFFSLLKEAKYDLGLVYSQDPNSVYSMLLLVAFLAIIIGFFAMNAIKKAQLLKVVSKIEKSSNFSEFDENLTKIATELPKRGVEVANSLNSLKNDILNAQFKLIKDFNIKDKIDSYTKLSQNYSLIGKNSKKYNIEELSKFYEEKSTALLNENLAKEIENYYKNSRFTQKDVEYVNAIVKYANSFGDSSSILKPLQNEIDKFSLGFNFELFKFIKSLDKNLSGQIYINCNEKIDRLFENQTSRISSSILKYMLEKNEKQKVYDYISFLKDASYLQSLYLNLFGKSDDINLDLAFVKNDTEIKNDYKEYLDSKITFNWKDVTYIKHILNAPRVLQVIGHIDYRNVLERIEKLESEVDFNATVAKILEVAKSAEKIAKEAKAIARSK